MGRSSKTPWNGKSWGVRGANQGVFCVRGMDIFRNHTVVIILHYCHSVNRLIGCGNNVRIYAEFPRGSIICKKSCKLAIETVSVLTPTLEKLKGVFPKLNSIQMLHFLSKNKNNGLYGWMHM